MNPRIDPHDVVFLVVHGNIAAEGVHKIDGVFGKKFIGSRGVGKRSIVKGADGANVCEVAAEFGEEKLLDVSVDFGRSASTGRSKIVEASNFLTEADAASAVNASVHMSHHQGPDILILYGPLELVVSAFLISVEMRVVLQVALASLIADRAVERVIGEQKLHDSSSSVPGGLGIGVDFHGWGDLGAAGSHGFGGLFDFYEAHPAVAGDFETFMVAEARNLDVIFLGGLEDREVVIDLVRLVVDEYLYLLGGEGSVGPEHLLENRRTQQHQTDQYLYYTPYHRQASTPPIPHIILILVRYAH